MIRAATALVPLTASRVMKRLGVVLALLAWTPTLQAQAPDPPPTLEYRVKAAFILNFVRYVDWPEDALGTGPLTICVAGRNPFGNALVETVQGETVGNRPLAVRVILEPEPGCHAMFIPAESAVGAYLRATRLMPVLTIGESGDFISQGGMINFVLDGANVRFAIDQQAVERSGLRVSSRLMRLAQPDTRAGSL
jgi:hypothetical protein